jgi:YHS domain-containing protein
MQSDNPEQTKTRRRWFQFNLRTLMIGTAIVAVTLAIWVAWPPIGLEGYCPVTLTDEWRWELGDPYCFSIYRGILYRFAGKEQKKKFRANRQKYAPAATGYDVVLARDRGVLVPGKRQHGIWYNSRVYLFDSEDSLQRFCLYPKRYTKPAMESEPNRDRCEFQGCCLVTLSEDKQWKAGEVRYSVDLGDRVYLFVGPNQKRCFLEDPGKYLPACEGQDIVLAFDEGRLVPGCREYTVVCDGQIHLFAGKESMDKFCRDPAPYAAPEAQDVTIVGPETVH